ncbi:MAG: uroporphyrinogen decarboxylase family protein [Actinomycetota bacterium]|nr:uroporphyrinogen decarboxylase family protein [Actinomycetota bacterium]
MPFVLFSLARSLACFSLDSHRIPDKVKAACDVTVNDMLTIARMNVRITGVERVFVGDSRSSPLFISPSTFEYLVFPQLKKMVGELARRGIVSILHFDTDWSAFLPFLLQLPRRSCVLELDGCTDMVKAKGIPGIICATACL